MPDDAATPHDHDIGILCALPPEPPPNLPDDLSAPRAEAILLVQNKWVNGTVLHFGFLQQPGQQFPEPQREIVRWAFKTWKALGIGLDFKEVADLSEAELIIGMDLTDGSWSFVGTGVLSNRRNNRTMNYGWDLTTEWGKATALHEIGHAIGMPHEHQNPQAGIVWNEEAVYADLGGPPNSWPRPKVFSNILAKLPIQQVTGSNWDPKSIMHYPFKPGMITAPPPYDVKGIGRNVALSPGDTEWVRKFFPEQKAKPKKIGVMELQALPTGVGDQADFAFEPDATRDYTIQTLGLSDCKIVVFEERDGEPRHLVAEDDSGQDTNAKIVTKMVKGRRYYIRTRVHYVEGPAGVGLLVL